MLTEFEQKILIDIYNMNLGNGKVDIDSYPLVETDRSLKNKEYANYLTRLEKLGYLVLGSALVKGGNLDTKYNNNVIMIFVEKVELSGKGLEYVRHILNQKAENSANNIFKLNNSKLNDSNITSGTHDNNLASSATIRNSDNNIYQRKSNWQTISDWITDILIEVTDESFRNVLIYIDSKLKGKFDVQWIYGKTKNSVYLYQVNNKVTVFANLKLEDKFLKCLPPSGLKDKSLKAHKSIGELKNFNLVDSTNVERFVDILLKALENPEDTIKKDDSSENSSEIIMQYDNDSIKITSIDSDTIAGEDLLNISKDVKSVANLIALRKLNTPLSIGLFGDWGSGKSFFMRQVQKKIEEISIKSRTVTEKIKTAKHVTESELQYKELFCDKIVHINFNAWHYVDANLWASLVSHIFDKISENLNPKNANSDATGELKLPFIKELESTKELEKELCNKKQKLNDEYSKKSEELNELRIELDEKEKEKKEISISDIVRKIIKDEDVINKIKEEFPNSEELSKVIGKAVEAKDGFLEALRETKGLSNQIYHVWRILNRKSKILIVVIGLISILLSIALHFVKVDINEFIKLLFVVIARLTSLLLPIIGFFKIRTINNAKKKVKDWYDYLTVLADKQDTEKKRLETEVALELNNIRKEIAGIEKDSARLKTRIQSIENEIKDIDDGKYIKYFIEKRINSSDYTKHLGIINLIRKDFEVLSTYLQNPKPNTECKIDRIVLYIDDLDRCPPENVVQVLQAIHLILAFELFVVVVAVDVRWVSCCLRECYKTMFSENYEGNGTSCFDYLEKIFQIPIKLQTINSADSKQYIHSLLTSNLNNKATETDLEQGSLKEMLAGVSNISDVDTTSFFEDTDSLEIKSDVEMMQITEGDIKSIEEFVPLLGNTPRTIKRFVNIFRLLKANNPQIESGNREVLFLLSIVTGMPYSSSEIFKAIQSDVYSNFNELIKKVSELFENNEIEKVEMQKIVQFLESDTERPLSLDKLRLFTPVVSRYSFQ